jgi:hypothetical protein
MPPVEFQLKNGSKISLRIAVCTSQNFNSLISAAEIFSLVFKEAKVYPPKISDSNTKSREKRLYPKEVKTGVINKWLSKEKKTG